MILNDEDENELDYIFSFDHYCIYRWKVENVKNYTFILHGYRGPPFEAEWFWLVKLKNGKIWKTWKYYV